MKEFTPDPRQAKAFQDAVNHRLSGVKADPRLAQKIIAREQEEKKVKKRFSVGLAAAVALIMLLSVSLAESWPTVTEFLSTVGSHPDLVTAAPQSQEVVRRRALERVYAPVRVSLLNEAGEEENFFQLDALAAQIQYDYTLVFHTDTGEWSGEPGTPAIQAPGFPDGEGQAFLGTWLFESAEIQNLSVKADFTTGGSYAFGYEGHYRLTYRAQIALDKQGRIVSAESDSIVRPFTMRDKNGSLSDGCSFLDPLYPAGAVAAEPTPLPTVVPFLLDPLYPAGAAAAEPTSLPTVAPFPGEAGGEGESALAAALSELEETRNALETAYSLTDDLERDADKAQERLEAYRNSLAAAMDERAALSGEGDGNSAAPAASILDGMEPEEPGYNPLLVNFGHELPPVTHYYQDADGKVTSWEWNVDFFAARLVKERLPQLQWEEGQLGQRVEFDESFLRFSASADGMNARFTMLEKPRCVALRQGDVCEMHILGGLLGIAYESVLWRVENPDGTIVSLMPVQEVAPVQAEIPYDFMFILQAE